MSERIRAVLKSDGRTTIPNKIRQQLGMSEGSVIQYEVYGTDKILITVLRK